VAGLWGYWIVGFLLRKTSGFGNASDIGRRKLHSDCCFGTNGLFSGLYFSDVELLEARGSQYIFVILNVGFWPIAEVRYSKRTKNECRLV
jgi:hypothetical protein